MKYSDELNTVFIFLANRQKNLFFLGGENSHLLGAKKNMEKTY